MPGNAVDPLATEKTRDQIMAEREAKKLAKPATKIITEVEQTTITTKLTTTTTTKVQDAVASKTTQPAAVNGKDAEAGEKTREQIKAEREAKKAAKKAGKGGGAKVEGIAQQLADLKVAEKAPVAASAAPSTTEADQEKVTCYIYDFLASYTSHLTLHRKSQLLAKRSVALSKKPNGQPRPRYRLKRPSMQPRHHPAQLPKSRTGRAFPHHSGHQQFPRQMSSQHAQCRLPGEAVQPSGVRQGRQPVHQRSTRSSEHCALGCSVRQAHGGGVQCSMHCLPARPAPGCPRL